MKKLFVILLLSAVLGSFINSHDITINVREDGSAYVIEEYFLRINETERMDINDLSTRETSFSDWAKYGVTKSIVPISEKESFVAQVTESDFATIRAEYAVPKIVTAIEKKGRQEIVGITEKTFSFYDGQKISLPYEPPTQLIIKLPQTVKLSEEVTPAPYESTIEISLEGTRYTKYVWSYRKPFSSPTFSLLYEKELSLQSQLSPRALYEEIRDKYGNPVYIGAGVLILLLIIWYRKEVSLILSEAFASQEDIDIEDD